MRKRTSQKRHAHTSFQPIAWLPFDSRLFPFISFTHVKGFARVFIIVEMILAVGMVVGSLVLVLLAKLH